MLLLDEPTASLDPDTADWVRSRLEAYVARTGATVLLASHNMAEVERLCDRLVMLRQGYDRGRRVPGAFPRALRPAPRSKTSSSTSRGADGRALEMA